MTRSSDSERWQLLNSLFSQALSVERTQRSAFLDHACDGDRDLRQELELLLSAADDSDEFIAARVQEAAGFFCSNNDPQTLTQGSRFSHYSVMALLGSGGMGRVYLVEDVRLKRKVALKTLAPEYVGDPSALQRFEQEARATSALTHPNILTLHDIGEFEGTHFITCEFIEGATVRDKLRDGPLALYSAIDIAAQVAAGLAAAHALGITHRDIKPENIIVRNDGLVKIVDFGVAKLTEMSRVEKKTQAARSASAQSTIACSTGPGKVIGTVKYMSPEQARGLPVDGRSDLFSLGTVLYEMVTGRAAFRGDTESDLVAEILKTEPPALRQIAPAAPAELGRIVTKAISKDRSMRYESATELASDLRLLQNRLAFPSAGGRPARPGRAGWFAVGAMILIAAIFTVFYWRPSAPPIPAGPRRLAILPFRNLKPDPATDFLGFSLADAVITKFAGIGSLMVRPSSSVDRFRNQVIDPEKAASELDVDTLLTGTYLKEGEELRIATQLISAKPAAVLWERTMDVKYENLLSVQDAIAQQIISALALRLTPNEAAGVRFNNAIDRFAYEDYLRGVDLYATNDFRSAIEMLERSAARAPAYALTWAHLGRAYTTNASLAFGGREQYGKAQAAYQRALRLNPTLIETRVYMANLFTDTGHVEQALPLIRAALRANPNYAEAHWELGYAYRFAGLLSDSIAECERARQLDPQVKLHSSALNSYLYVGDYAKFLASLPSDETAYILFYRGFGEYYLHRWADAERDFKQAYQVDPSLLQAEVGDALLSAMRGRPADGLRLMQRTEAKIRERGVADAEGVYKIAQAYAVLGDDASALRILQRAVEGGFFCYPYFQTDPLLSSVRHKPQFAELIAESRNLQERFKALLTSDSQ